MSTRTYKLTTPHMTGDDIRSWQRDVKHEFARMDIDCPIAIDGDYGMSTRSFTASLCHALGMTASKVMAEGVTPELRSRIRNRILTPEEQTNMRVRVDWRRRLRDRFESMNAGDVHRLTRLIITSEWDYHGRAHDGIDVQTPNGAWLYAMVKCRVFDVRSGGWWGKAPSGDVSLGDGIVQMEVLDNVGPFKKGHHIGYGHCENAVVKEGDVLEAGDRVARVGLAVTRHVHLMENDGSTTKGIGNIDPRAILDYATKHG